MYVNLSHLRHTPLHAHHIAAGGRMVDFAGWSMPIDYGSQRDEHRAVREGAGMFDVSHMGLIDITGQGALGLLRYLTSNDVATLPRGRARYSCLLNALGGVQDDLIIYAISPTHYLLVVNAARAQADLTWLVDHSDDFAVSIELRHDVIVAVQGPQAIESVHRVLPSAWVSDLSQIERFGFRSWQDDEGCTWFVARTGYTGEDGYELILPASAGASLWQKLTDSGVRPIGLGARDTLRLEAGMSLYGQDLDDFHSPFESGVGWTVDLESSRDFVGREALIAQREAGVPHSLSGLVLRERGVLRREQPVLVDGRVCGHITSGTFSPTLGQSIALVRLARGTQGDCQVQIRDKLLGASVVATPFVRKGVATF